MMTEREIFTAALEKQSAAERAAYLDGACASDPARRERIEGLLRESENLNSFFDRPPAGIAVEECPTVDRPPAEQPRTHIGPYKLLEQIGEGGMGIVYMAQQMEPVKRKVALKVIKPGMDSRQVVARFEAERQALALMDHAHIARVFDAGATESGRPYFVMELVRGVPITEYCDKQRLAAAPRLKLFIDVCQAVQHAHLKGIIHRDLKPSNVLVTLHDGVPVVKVIDFGVAKAIGQELTERTLFTQFSQMVGTPLYMSPEQAELSGLDIDTRTDVYSLGVLLYELLTGTTPFDKERLKSVTFDEMRRIIREEEPETVSARLARTRRVGSAHQIPLPLGEAGTTPRAWSRRAGEGLPAPASIPHSAIRTPQLAELDWIVMKSLEKDRSRRYESASALAADIQRYLSDEPVLACPPTTMYRFQKFARKHKPALATAAAIALCLLLGTTVSAWQAVRATTAEAQANANATQAQASSQEAKEKAQEAKEKAQEATTQRDEAQRQRDEARALAEQLRRTTYVAEMNLAKHAWDAGGAGRTLELLEHYRPKPSEADLRGFEWHYLYRLCHSDLFTVKVDGRPSAVSPDGKQVAGDRRRPVGTVVIWDAQTGKETFTLKGHTHIVMTLAFSPDGKRLASGEAAIDERGVKSPSDVKVWDTQTGREIVTLKGHTNWVRGVAFSPDGRRLASASSDQTVKVWDAQTGGEIFTLKGHTSGVYNVAFSPDGKRLASAGSDQMVKVWDAQTAQEIFTLKGHTAGVNDVAFSPDGKRLASASDDQTVKVWEVETGQETLSLTGHNGGVSVVVFSRDGKRLASTGYDQTLKVWDAQTGHHLLTLMGHTGGILGMAFGPDSKRLFSVSGVGEVKTWDVQTDPEIRVLKGHSKWVNEVAFSPDGKRLASASADRTVKVWDVATGQENLTLRGHTSLVGSVAFSPDGKRLASGSTDRTVMVWDAATGQEVLTLKGHVGPIWGVAFSPDGKRLASGSGNNYDEQSRLIPGGTGVKVWDAESGRELLDLEGGRGTRSIGFSPDGKRLASSSTHTVSVWDSNTGQRIFTITPGWRLGEQIFFSPDGKRLACSLRSVFKLWDSQTGQELSALPLKGHVGQVSSAAYSPDEKRLASTSGDGKVKIWDAQTGAELLTLNGTTRFSDYVVFSPDGHRLAANIEDGTVVAIWDATPLPEKP